MDCVHHHKQKYSQLCLSQIHIMLDPRLPFTDSVGGILPGPATTQGIEWFSQLAGL